MKDKLYSVILTIALIFFVLTASIAAPLVCRAFYYAHIEALDLPEKTGWTYEQIKDAYDEMMDFCMNGEEFGTGDLKWSEDGKEHFADCAVLFQLDLHVLLASAIILILCVLLNWKGLRPVRLWKRGPFFWAGTLLGGGFLIIAGLAATDFDRAFVIFHHMFFPGKSNWLFDPAQDEIIRVLPEVFFRNCAILIVGCLFSLCAILIVVDFLKARKENGRSRRT